MSELDFLKQLNSIDDDLILAADTIPVKKKNNTAWITFVAAAASICIIAGIGLFARHSSKPATSYTDTIISFTLDDKSYEIANLNNYVSYCLVDEASTSRNVVSVSSITASDLGDYMGTISVDGKTKYKVYHYLAYPDSDKVCILEISKNTYQLYVIRE